jgi:hypothetical protein
MRSQIMMTIQNKISDKLTPVKLASASVMAIKATNWNDSGMLLNFFSYS